jgi:Sulfotransferase family
MENPIFVVGLPRTGSSLLENMLGRNAEVLRLAEMLFLSPWRRDFRFFLRKNVGRLSEDKQLIRLVDIIFSPHERVAGIDASFWRLKGLRAMGENELKKRVVSALQRSDRSLGSIFRILLQEITAWNNYSRCCVAFPVYINHIPELLSWFPKGQIVHITRDPRAIAVSKTNDPGGTAIYNAKYPKLKFAIRKAMVAFTVLQYLWSAKVHEQYRNHPNYRLIRYEDLITDPEAVLQEICVFLQLTYSRDMLAQDSHWAQPSSISGQKLGGIDTQRAATWKSVITPLEETLITYLTRRSMRRFGFDFQNHPVYTTCAGVDPYVSVARSG